MIKGGFFLKSLKQLFIISLIICFILLVNSSVSALNIQDQQLGSTITKSLNFVPNPLDMESSLNQLSYKYGRTDEGYIYLGIESNYNGFQNLFGTVRFNYNDQYCSNTTPSLDFYDNIANGIFKPTYFSITSSDYTNTDNYLKFCDSNNNCYYSCCRFYNNTNNNTTYLTCGQGPSSVSSVAISISEVGGSFPVNNSPYSLGGGTSFNPSTGSRLGGRLITSSGYTNNQMIEGYQCVGLTPELCYGGFPINDIFEPSETFEDFTGYLAGQGATIFDLYSLYPSYSNINQFLSTYLLRFQNGWTFKNEPKSLYMLFSQINNAGFKTSYISTYCDLLLNKNNNSTYTGNSVDDLRAQSCYRSQHINDSLKNSYGSDIVGQGSDVGIFGSGDDVDFDPETFFSNMMEKISSGLDSVSTGTAVGVIPGYIILFTLALIFIRMISH